MAPPAAHRFEFKRLATPLFQFGPPALVVALLLLPTASLGDDFSQDSRFFRVLSAPMTSVLDGKSFRDGLLSITSASGVNVWLDRHVDPTVPIECGPLGPTVYAAIEKLATAHQCTVMPVANVILVGRENWVDYTASQVLSLPPSQRGETIDVSWQALTTPSEAFHSAAGETRGDLPTLEHDLWPAVNWQRIERQVALLLIVAQMKPMEQTEATRQARQSGKPFSRRYSRASIPLVELRAVMRGADSSSQVRASGEWLIATGSMMSHRAASSAILRRNSSQAKPDPDRDTFTLKSLSTSAENAFRQLAQTAGRTFRIELEAAEACQRVVSLEGNDLTLRQLIDLVASQAGVMVQWEAESIVVSLPRED